MGEKLKQDQRGTSEPTYGGRRGSEVAAMLTF